MGRLAVFGSGALRALAQAEGRGLAFVPAEKAKGRLEGALVELRTRATRDLGAARALCRSGAVGALDLRPTPKRRLQAG